MTIDDKIELFWEEVSGRGETLYYTYDWAMYMSIIDKIETLRVPNEHHNFTVEIVGSGSSKSFIIKIKHNFTIVVTGSYKLDIVHEGIIKFIDWWNKNKE